MENTITVRNTKGIKVNRPAVTPEEQLAAMRKALEQEKAKRIEAEQEAARLKASKSSTFQGITCKVSVKGCVSVYGLGRHPVSLYKTQWLKLLKHIEEVAQFIADHDEELPVKQ